MSKKLMVKKPWLSKTIWSNIIMAVVAFFPGVNEWFVANPDALVMMFTIANVLLRLITKDKLSFSE